MNKPKYLDKSHESILLSFRVMVRCMTTVAKSLKVFQSIIGFIMINMVNMCHSSTRNVFITFLTYVAISFKGLYSKATKTFFIVEYNLIKSCPLSTKFKISDTISLLGSQPIIYFNHKHYYTPCL